MKQKRKFKKPSLTITPQQKASFPSESGDSDTQPTEPCQVPTPAQTAGETSNAAPAAISQHNKEQSQNPPAAPAVPAGKSPEFRRLALPATNKRAQTEIATQDTIENPALPTAKADITRLATAKSPILVDEKEDISRLDTAKSAAPPEEDRRKQTQQGLPPLAVPPGLPPVPPVPPIRPAISASGMAERKPSGRTRWTRWLHIVLLISMVLPTLLIIIEGLNAAMLYTYAHEGVQHLLNVKNVFTGAQAHPSGLLDANKLRLAQSEFTAAQNNFKLLDEKLRNDPVIGIAGGILPQQVTSARALSRIGVDITEMGQQLVKTALILAPTFRGPLLADNSKPLVTQPMLNLIGSTIDYLLPRLNDIQAQSRQLSLDTLPISAQQRQQLTSLLQALPQAQADLAQSRELLGAADWMLGVSEPRTFLVQTMDRSELRPTGGFTGQFGELTINGGRIAPFTLKNIGPYEEGSTALPEVIGKLAPQQYSWWPFPNWGLRDSNLSADFPTSARLAIAQYQLEFKRQVDGVIVFSPFLISRILQITGPITIPEYQETITAQNLEERLHYYQLDNAGIRKEEIVEHVEDPTQARKLFTARLARILMDHVRHAPPDELITLAREMLHDLKTRDLQVYVTNPQIQRLLSQHGMAGEMDRSTKHDGLYVVQANASASKASQYVRTILHDTVSLDAAGGATHTLQIRLIYNQIGPVYGLDTYRDYIRVYVPPTAQLRSGHGFDSGIPLCGGPFQPCPQYDVHGDGTLLCPRGLTSAGYAAEMLNDPYIHGLHPINKVGGPTSTRSDEPGRHMFAGWVIIPKNCTATVTLSWYVPPAGQQGYALLVQRQSSTYPELDLTILPPPSQCATYAMPGLHFTGILNGQDVLFSLAKNTTGKQAQTACVPQLKA